MILRDGTICANPSCYEKLTYHVKGENALVCKSNRDSHLSNLGWAQGDTGAEVYDEESYCGWFCPRCVRLLERNARLIVR